jgi:hypothetical protein
MTQILQLAHLIEQHRMPQMQVRCCGIKTCFNPQRAARNKSLYELLLYQQLVTTPLDNLQLV